MSIITAQVAKVPFGSIEIDGLLFTDGSFGVAIPQLVDVKLIQRNLSLKRLESSLGIHFQSGSKAKTTLHPKAVNTISLLDLEMLIIEQVSRGNEVAKQLASALVGLTLTQVFSDAFHIKFEKEDRQNWLKTRLAGKLTRRSLTDSIKEWYERNPDGTTCPYGIMFPRVTDAIYKVLWGLDAKGLETLLDCGRHVARDHMTAEALKALDRAEARVMEFIDEDNIKPIDAVVAAALKPSKHFPK